MAQAVQPRYSRAISLATGITHAYENSGDQPLEIVEMQWREGRI